MPRNASYLSTASVDSDSTEEAKAAFGEKVRSLMNNLGLSQSALARDAGLRRDAISTYIRGKVFPDPGNLRKLANALGVTPRDLIPGISEVEAVGVARAGAARIAMTRNAVTQTPSLSFTITAPGQVHLTFSQTLSLDTATKIVEMVNKEQSASRK